MAQLLKTITIKQTRSAIRRHHSQRETLIGLRLNKIGRISELEDTPSIRGMISKVQHLVSYVDEPVRRRTPFRPPPALRAELPVSAKISFQSAVLRRTIGRPAPERPGKKAGLEAVLDRLGNGGPEERVGALYEVASLVNAWDRDKEMDRGERLRLATIPRRVYSKLFDPNAAVAQQAAYSLLVCSKSYSGDRKTLKIADLDASEIDHVREDLQKLLPKLGDRYYSYIDKIGSKRSGNTLELKVRVRLSRQLPFSLNGRPVIIAGETPQLSEPPHFSITSVPGSVGSVAKMFKATDPEWRDGDFFLADCDIRLSLARKRSKLPVLVTVDGLVVDGHSLNLR